MSHIGKSYRKKDAMQLLTGKPLYTNDLAPRHCLIVKVLRSPHANALVEELDTAIAKKIPGIEAIYTFADVDQEAPRYTNAGQSFPEVSPHDRLLLDRHVRFVGDVVAIVAGTDEKCVDRALFILRKKVKYQVLEPVLDPHKAIDNPVLVHPENTWERLVPVGGNAKRNLSANQEYGSGDAEKLISRCDVVLDRTYHMKANQQCMMESFRTFCEIDAYGRLHVTSSTQVVFHCRRIIAAALHIPTSKVRVTKPRIGGGFGAKQTSVSEVYPAFVTWKTKKPSKMLFTRAECLTAGSPRHDMELHMRIGATKKGKIRAITLHTLSNTGAYGEHGSTTADASGHKSLSMYKTEAYRVTTEVVYTNKQPSGAYRGYGATQGAYALECAINELAAELQMDPCSLRLRNVMPEGGFMPSYYNSYNTSSRLAQCLVRVQDMSHWFEHPRCVDLGNGKVRAWGVALGMQGSAVRNVDMGGATLKVDDGGTYTLIIGAADMGTGCDTILAQIAAEVLECELDDISVLGADTDFSPYDSGSYASSTTYITGKAVEECALKLRKKICTAGAKLLQCAVEEVEFDGRQVSRKDGQASVTLFNIAYKAQCGNDFSLEENVILGAKASPPPYMAGVAEIVLDKLTGEVQVENYYACVDCGTVINEHLATVQAEGGILQGIGMALYEDVQYSPEGRVYENSFMQYKIPSRLDIGHIHVDFRPSYEKSGPFGAKSIGEVVINTCCPAITNAVYNATGHFFREVPITPEQIAMACAED